MALGGMSKRFLNSLDSNACDVLEIEHVSLKRSLGANGLENRLGYRLF